MECTKFVFDRGFAPDPAIGELTALPRLPSWSKEGATSKGKGEERGKRGEMERGEEGEGTEGVGPAPLRKFLDPSLANIRTALDPVSQQNGWVFHRIRISKKRQKKFVGNK